MYKLLRLNVTRLHLGHAGSDLVLERLKDKDKDKGG